MNTETLELLEKINWILQPIAKAFFFLFTTKTGLALLLVGVIIFWLATLYNSYRVRHLLSSGTSSYGRGSISIFDRLYIFVRDTAGSMLKLIAWIPMIAGIILTMLIITGVATGIDYLTQMARNQQRIEELSAVVRQLDRNYRVASIEVVSQDFVAGTSTLKIAFYDQLEQGKTANTQNLTLKGYDIYFDALVLNFDYSVIAMGEKRNITLPYRLYSEQIPPIQGIALNYTSEAGIPFMFNRADSDVFVVQPDEYKKHLLEIMELATNSDKARKAGVRSVVGNAVHKRMRVGQIHEIWIEQTGGLVLKQTAGFAPVRSAGE